MPSARPRVKNSAQSVLDVGEQMACERGYNGFSYADIAARLGVTKACLHYHFAGKADLGLALARRQRERRGLELTAINSTGLPARTRLLRYAALYGRALETPGAGLRGVLAAESRTLPDALQREVAASFADELRWLVALLTAGRRRRELGFSGAPQDRAAQLMAALEGTLLIARAQGVAPRLAGAVRRLVLALR